MKSRIVLAGFAVAVVALVGGCGSSSESSPSASPSATSSSSSQVVSPVIISEDQDTATAKVGEFVVLNVADPTGVTVSSSDPKVIDIKQGYSDGSAAFNPGGPALSAGDATLTLVYPDGRNRVVELTVTD